jgi:hypothetical protein
MPVVNAGRGSRPGFSSSVRDVGDGRQAECLVDEVGRLERAEHRAVADQRPDVATGWLHNAAHEGIGLRVHAGWVERVVAAVDAQESGALLERLPAEQRHVDECPAGAEGPGGVAVRHDVAGELLADAGHAGQQRRGRGVHVDPDRVHAVLHHRVEGAGQLRAGQVALLLPDTDRPGIDLDQLGERVLQPAGDGHRAA